MNNPTNILQKANAGLNCIIKMIGDLFRFIFGCLETRKHAARRLNTQTIRKFILDTIQDKDMSGSEIVDKLPMETIQKIGGDGMIYAELYHMKNEGILQSYSAGFEHGRVPLYSVKK